MVLQPSVPKHKKEAWGELEAVITPEWRQFYSQYYNQTYEEFMEKLEQCKIRGEHRGIAKYEELIKGFKVPPKEAWHPVPSWKEGLGESVEEALVKSGADLPHGRRAPDPRDESYPHGRQWLEIRLELELGTDAGWS
jgi:hypothetical protein